jgi:hypothetical protein
MSKTKNNELKFSIRNLIDTTSCEKNEKGISTESTGIHHPSINRSLKRLVTEPQTPLIRRPIPTINHKNPPHPCWSFLSQLTNRNSNGIFPFNSLIFLSKMGQVWEQIQQTQNSPNDDVSDEDTSSIREEDDDEEEEEDDDEGECSSSGGDKLNPSSNSEENDKLKTYPCTQCGKVSFNFCIFHQ